MIPTFEPGKCRYCGCTESDPCRLQDGDECSWLNTRQTVCNAPGCQRQYYAALAALAPRKRRLTSVDINKLICGRGRKKTAKKGRAA
jgi:hypothetical protein